MNDADMHSAIDESDEDIYDDEYLKQFEYEESDASSCAGCCFAILCWPLWILALMLLIGLILQHFQFATITAGVLGFYVVSLVISILIKVVYRAPNDVADRCEAALEREYYVRKRDARSCKKFSVYHAGRRHTKAHASIEPYYDVVQLDTRRRALIHIGLEPNQRISTPQGVVVVAGVGPVSLCEKDDNNREIVSATYGTTLYVVRNSNEYEFGNNVAEPTTIDVTKPQTMTILGWKKLNVDEHDNANREPQASKRHSDDSSDDEESSEGDIFVNKVLMEERFAGQSCVAQCCLIWLVVPFALSLGLTVYFLVTNEPLSATISGALLAFFALLCLISAAVLIAFRESTKSADARSDARKSEFAARSRNQRSHLQFYEKNFFRTTGKAPQFSIISLDTRRRALAPFERNQTVQTRFGTASVIGFGPISYDESLHEAHYCNARIFVTYDHDHHRGVPVVHDHRILDV